MPQAILNIDNAATVEPESIQNQMSQRQVRLFVIATYVVDLARDALFQHCD